MIRHLERFWFAASRASSAPVARCTPYRGPGSKLAWMTPVAYLTILTSLTHADPIYVDAAAAAGGDGSSWAAAFYNLQDALTLATGGGVTEIRVAQGVYRPDVGVGQTAGARESTFQLLSGVAVRGGFAGIGATDPDERDIVNFATILSGDLSGNDIGNRFDPTHYENAYHIVTASDTDATAVLDGVTVTAGRADGGEPYDSGTGIYNDAGSPTIVDCTFFEHRSFKYGGVICNVSGAHPVIRRCLFFDNSGDYGGAIYNGGQSNSTIDNCRFIENTVGYHGGAIYNGDQSHSTITDCTLLANESYFQGGGIANFGNSNPLITRCLLEKNLSTHSAGGGVYNDGSSPTFVDSTFLENHAAISGGGMYNAAQSGPTLEHCAFQGNDSRNGGGLLNISSGATLNDCLFERNVAIQNGGAIYSLSTTTVEMTNCTVTRNVAMQNAGGLYNSGSNPVLYNTILWNNSDATGLTLAAQIQGGSPTIDYSCITSFDTNIGVGNRNDDPLFVSGPAGCSYLQSGTSIASPCVDAGGDTAIAVGLNDRTTRVDEAVDTDSVDMGFHYPVTGETCTWIRYQCERKMDLREYAAFAACFADAATPTDPCCLPWDADANGVIDLADFETLQPTLTSP